MFDSLLVVPTTSMSDLVLERLRSAATDVRLVRTVPNLQADTPDWADRATGVCVWAMPPNALTGSIGGSEPELWAGPLADALQEVMRVLRDVAAANAPSDVDRHVIVVTDGPMALGAAGTSLGSAFVGAVISLVRTAAVELARNRVWVNCVLIDPEQLTGERASDVDASDVVEVILGMLRGSARGVTGQEVFVTGGLGTGRLLP